MPSARIQATKGLNMPNKIRVGIGFRVSDEVITQIEAVDPNLEAVPLFGLSSSSRVWSDGSPEDREALLRDVATVDILFGPGGIPGEFLRAATNLKWFQVINAGVDRLHTEGLLGLGYKVTNVSGLTAASIAEYVLGSMIMFTKGMHTAMRNQAEHKWLRTGSVGELAGTTCGIAGMGAIGRETAIRARAMGMRIVATRRTVMAGDADPDCDVLLPFSENARLLEQSDFVVLCVPLTPETRHLIGAPELDLMKRTACLINLARGEVVDQDALIAALREGTIAGAILDVTVPEPLGPDSALWDLPNAIVTPHLSGSISGYGHRSAEMFIANLRRYIAGEALHQLVDPQLGY